MPKNIKTRETEKNIKTAEKPAFLSVQIKKALIRTRNTAVRTAEPEPSAEESRPEETAQEAVEDTAARTVHVAVSVGQKAIRRGSRIMQKREEAPPLYEDAQWEAIPSEQRTMEQGRQLARKQAEARTMKTRPARETTDARTINAEARRIHTKQTDTEIRHSGHSVKTAKLPIRRTESSRMEQAHQPTQTARIHFTRRKAESHGAKTAERSAKSIVRRILDAAKTLNVSITTGMAVAATSVVLVCLVGLMAASPFGIFFSNEDSGTGCTMPGAVTILNREFSQVIEQIKENAPHDHVEMDNAGSAEMVANWSDVLAVYAVRTTTQNDAVEVATVTEEKLELLREIFWDMNHISHYTETVGDAEHGYSTVLHIVVDTTSCQAMAGRYHFTAEQRELLTELMQPKYAELFQLLTGSYQDIALSQEEIQDILDRLPEDLSEKRRQVVLTAYQLLDKVDYFWGGKPYVLGWDSRWGTPMRVTSPGSTTTGTVRPFGLDCSGYVDWVFYNATNGVYTPSGGNGGTTAQKNNGTAITWAEALPGDLVFYLRVTHVGIICGYDETDAPLVIHCASGWDTVIVTGKGAFVSLVRPEYYN